MAAKDGSNEAWRDDKDSCCSTFIASLVCESTEQKAVRPRKYKGLWFLSLR